MPAGHEIYGRAIVRFALIYAMLRSPAFSWSNPMKRLMISIFALAVFSAPAMAANYGDAKPALQQMPSSGTWFDPCAVESVRVLPPETTSTTGSSGSSIIMSGGVTSSWRVSTTVYEALGGRIEVVQAKDEADATKIRDQIAAMRNGPACTGPKLK